MVDRAVRSSNRAPPAEVEMDAHCVPVSVTGAALETLLLDRWQHDLIG